MNRQAGVTSKHSREIEWGSKCGRSYLVERYRLGQTRGKKSLGGLNAFGMVGGRRWSPFQFKAVTHKSSFQDVGHKLQGRDVSPKRFMRFDLGAFKTPYEFAMAPKDLPLTRPGGKWKRLRQTVIDGRIEFTDDVDQYRLAD